MNDHGKEMLDAIMRAMEIEKETFDFYTRAEHKTFNPEGKRIFRWLARTEEQHYLTLSELYQSLHKEGRWVFYGGSTVSLEPAGPDERQVAFDTDDRQALEIAMAIEKKGIAHFEELMEKTTDPQGKSMLRTLRDEEAEHLRIIMEKHNALKPAAGDRETSCTVTFRIEKDTLGEVRVPAAAYYGAQTARAVENFPISGLMPHPALVRATVLVKKCAAQANMATARLDVRCGNAIVRAADECLAGAFDAHFVVDPFQAGAGTSHNMNVNEVLANRANELLGEERGGYAPVHPNDHVNMAQSTNDVFPTAMRLAALRLAEDLRPALAGLVAALRKKSAEFDDILKSGRTHLQDAVPIRLGQEFEAWALALEKNLAAVEGAVPGLAELGIGGTAAGTGMNAEPAYIDLVVAELARETGFPLVRGANLVERMQNMDPFVALSSALKGLAVNLARIANDLRLLSSGPRTGLAEIALPALQPGSSIMPGKVNPVMAEVTDMVAFQVMGADTTIMLAAQAGQLELNVMMPVIAFNLLFSLEILKNTVPRLADACIAGITADRERCLGYLEQSVGLATVLAPYIGYVAAAEVAKESTATGRSIRQIVEDRQLLSAGRLAEILDPFPLTSPGVPGAAHQAENTTQGGDNNAGRR